MSDSPGLIYLRVRSLEMVKLEGLGWQRLDMPRTGALKGSSCPTMPETGEDTANVSDLCCRLLSAEIVNAVVVLAWQTHEDEPWLEVEASA